MQDVFSSDVVEMDVCSSDYVVEGQLKEVEMERYKVVIFREKGQVRAFSGLCPQYRAPLKKGALRDHLVCLL